MATRPVFEVSTDEKIFVKRDVQFKWFGGRTLEQIRTNIHGLHGIYLAAFPGKKILEISSIRDGVSLESAFQGSKVFKLGGPYVDIIGKPSVYAKSDGRLKKSGALIGFRYEGKDFPINPPAYFYNWLYVTTLVANKDLANELLARDFDAFTDIAFNPDKGKANCQAQAAAIFVSLSRQKLLDTALADSENFLRTVYHE